MEENKMVTPKSIQNELIIAIKKVTGKKVGDMNTNFFSSVINITPVDFLYIIDIINQRYGIKCEEILRDRECDVMCVNELSNEIYKYIENRL